MVQAQTLCVDLPWGSENEGVADDTCYLPLKYHKIKQFSVHSFSSSFQHSFKVGHQNSCLTWQIDGLKFVPLMTRCIFGVTNSNLHVQHAMVNNKAT